MNEHRDRLARRLLLAVLFLLPWQTRYMFATPSVGHAVWQYGVVSVYGTELLVLLAVTLLGWDRVAKGLAAWFWPLIAVGLSVVFARLPWLGLVYVFHAACAVLLVQGVRVSAASPRAAAHAFVLGLVPVAALAWWQTATGGNGAFSWLGLAARDASQAGVAVVETAAGRLMRAYGPLPHPNMLGGFAAVGLFAAFRLTAASRREVLLKYGGLAVAGSVLALSFSRAAAIGTLLAAAWLAFRLRRRALPALTAAAAGILLTVLPFAPSFLARADAGNRLEQASVNERVSQLKEWSTVFLQNPVTGVGPGNYTAVLVMRDATVPAWASQPVHNALLLLLAEVGFLGFFAFLSVVGPKAWLAWENADGEGKTWGLAFALVLLPVMCFDHYLWSLWPGMSLAAAAIVSSRKQES